MKAQNRIANSLPNFGAYTGTNQNVIINNDQGISVPIGGNTNPNDVTGSSKLNLVGGFGNTAQDATSNLLYGRDNFVDKSDNGFVVGDANEVLESDVFLSVGTENRIESADEAYAIGNGTEIDNLEMSVVIGFGTKGTNVLEDAGAGSVTMGTEGENTFNILPSSRASNFFSDPVTGIGTTSPTAKLEIQNTGAKSQTSKALSVLNNDQGPLFNVREDGAASFNLPAGASPDVPYQFEESDLVPNGFTNGGQANIVQNYDGFPLPTGKWLALGERPPSNGNQVAYGLSNTWDGYAGNFFLYDPDPSNSNSPRNLNISFQDANVSSPSSASNRMRFIWRNSGSPIQPSNTFELMSLYPEGEVAVGDYSGSVSPDAQLEVKGDPNDNISTLFEVLEGGSSSSRGTEVLTVNDNGNVGIGLNNPSAQLEVTTNNPIKDNAGDWAGASDKRLKKNIENYQDGLKELMQIRPVWYQFNSKMDHLNNPNEKYVGVIAQETKEVAPYMVEKSYEVDGKKYYSLNSTAFTYMLINAVQEQEKKLESKDEQINKLQKRDQQQQEAIEELKGKYEQLVEKIKGNEDKASRFKKSGKEDLNEKTVSIGEAVHDEAMLLQNRPNPYNNKTIIPYYLPENFQSASLVISSTNGKLIERVSLNKTGKGEVTLQTANLDQGQYIYSLIVDGRKKASRKMIKQ